MASFLHFLWTCHYFVLSHQDNLFFVYFEIDTKKLGTLQKRLERCRMLQKQLFKHCTGKQVQWSIMNGYNRVQLKTHLLTNKSQKTKKCCEEDTTQSFSFLSIPLKWIQLNMIFYSKITNHWLSFCHKIKHTSCLRSWLSILRRSRVLISSPSFKLLCRSSLMYSQALERIPPLLWNKEREITTLRFRVPSIFSFFKVCLFKKCLKNGFIAESECGSQLSLPALSWCSQCCSLG